MTSWAEQGRILLEAVGSGNLSHPALVEEVWEAATSFCEVVMLAKEVAEHERKRLATDSRFRPP